MLLRDSKTGEILHGVLEKVNKQQLDQIKKSKNFNFDWDSELANEVLLIRLKDDNECLGLMSISDIYNDLRKVYTDDEIADSMLIPEDLSEEEQKTANEELKAFRLKLLKERTESQRIYSELMRFKYLMEDYIRQGNYISEHSFGNYLEEYIRILNRTKKTISLELDLHYTTLSRIINDREDPNIELMYRLEKHSGEIIPALFWWKLVLKKQEDRIKKDIATREKEEAHVKNAIQLKI